MREPKMRCKNPRGSDGERRIESERAVGRASRDLAPGSPARELMTRAGTPARDQARDVTGGAR